MRTCRRSRRYDPPHSTLPRLCFHLLTESAPWRCVQDRPSSRASASSGSSAAAGGTGTGSRRSSGSRGSRQGQITSRRKGRVTQASSSSAIALHRAQMREKDAEIEQLKAKVAALERAASISDLQTAREAAAAADSSVAAAWGRVEEARKACDHAESEAKKEEAAQARAQREVASLQKRLGADRPATAPTSSTTSTAGQ